jgi:methylphosphotriester-DNA--protein-cysteine methyltransferase
MIKHPSINSRQIKKLIRSASITLAGNLRLKIYGTLQCTSGKRMKKQNRVFFKDESEAIELGFRPCGHCLHSKYMEWKNR